MINVRVSTNKAFNAWTQDLFIPYVKLVRGGKKNVKRWKSGGETGVEFFGSTFEIDVKQVTQLSNAFFEEYKRELTRQMNRNRTSADLSAKLRGGGYLHYNKYGAGKNQLFNTYLRSLTNTTTVSKTEGNIKVGLNQGTAGKSLRYAEQIDEANPKVVRVKLPPNKMFPVFSRRDNKVKWYSSGTTGRIIILKNKPINTEKAAAVAWAKVKAQGL